MAESRYWFDCASGNACSSRARKKQEVSPRRKKCVKIAFGNFRAISVVVQNCQRRNTSLRYSYSRLALSACKILPLLRPGLILALGVTLHLLQVPGRCKHRWSINDFSFPVLASVHLSPTFCTKVHTCTGLACINNPVICLAVQACHGTFHRHKKLWGLPAL